MTKTATKIKTAGTIDMTPTWQEAARVIDAVLCDGNETGRASVRVELTRMAALADRYVTLTKPASTVGPEGENTRTSVAPNAERESVRATHHVRNECLSIKSDITPETVYFNHYPQGGAEGDAQLHVTVLQGVTGKGIFLSEADALLVRDFLNEFYPPK